MRYFGSKVSTIDTLFKLISAHIPGGTFCDPFGGIGSVGSFFKLKGYNVHCGDILLFAHYFQIARIKISTELKFSNLLKYLNLYSTLDLVNYLNSLHSDDGWFIREYAKKRQFFLISNAQRIQACRTHIKKWFQLGLINQNEHAILLASLINSMDNVANTAGTYYAYLKKMDSKKL